jgi:hypothetical protein
MVEKVWYCPDCAKIMEELYERRDRLHADYAEVLSHALLFELSEFVRRHPDARIPDAPDS